MDWTEGYVAELGYTHGYYPDLNPRQIALKVLLAGVRPPAISTACELGFGQGVSLLCHSAADNIKWYGNDFNPAQVNFASSAASNAGIDVNLSDEAFESYCSRSDLPNFDFIGLHGIWSWVSDRNRANLLDFIDRKLNTGGIVYVSYNCTAARSAIVPVRELMTEYSSQMFAPAIDLTTKISGSISFLEKLAETNPAFFTQNSNVAQAVKLLAGQDKAYLAHEYFNKDWRPLSFADVHRDMSSVKLTFVSSADPLEALSYLNYNKDQCEILKGLDSIAVSEMARDLLSNRAFRKDIWVKGEEKLTHAEQVALILDTHVAVVHNPDNVDFTVRTGLGNADLDRKVYEPILNILSQATSMSLRDISSQLKGRVALEQLIEATRILSAKGTLFAAEANDFSDAEETTRRLNNFFAAQSRYERSVEYLASPVTTTGIFVPRAQQLFMLGQKNGKKSPTELAEFAWSILEPLGHNILRDNQPLRTPEENISELNQSAVTFLEDTFNILNRLKVSL